MKFSFIASNDPHTIPPNTKPRKDYAFRGLEIALLYDMQGVFPSCLVMSRTIAVKLSAAVGTSGMIVTVEILIEGIARQTERCGSAQR